MTAKNDHTGAFMNSKASTDAYREGFDRIFGNKKKVTAEIPQGQTNSPIQGAGVDLREMSDREWAAQNPSLREGTTVHVPGVGDI